MNIVISLIKILAIGVALLFTSCNTVKGVGQDLESAGSAIEGSAERSY